MNQSLSRPVIIGGVVVAIVAVALFFMKGVNAEPHTPRPDPKMFGYSNTGTPKATPTKTP